MADHATRGEVHAHHLGVKKGTERLERHSGTGIRGTPKKHGGGGNYVWGKPGDEYNEPVVGALDKNDPNYDEDEDVTPEPKPPVDGPIPEPVVKKVLLGD